MLQDNVTDLSLLSFRFRRKSGDTMSTEEQDPTFISVSFSPETATTSP